MLDSKPTDLSLNSSRTSSVPTSSVANDASNVTSPPEPLSKSSNKTPVIAGSVIAVVAILTLTIGFIWIILRRRKEALGAAPRQTETFVKPVSEGSDTYISELGDRGIAEVYASRVVEMDGQGPTHELYATGRPELGYTNPFTNTRPRMN